MELTRLMRLIPTMDMIADDLEEANMPCLRRIGDPEKKYRGILPYTGKLRLEPDLVYLLRPEHAATFPTDTHAYICPEPIEGRANHLYCPGVGAESLLQRLLELFCTFQDQEAQLNALVFTDSDLKQLCDLGQRLTGNPVCIHDDWFILIASSRGMDEVMRPELVAESDRSFVPRQILEDFQFDDDYEQTYAQRRCQLWSQTPGTAQCLYVNLWQEPRYLGRLLIFQYEHPFRAKDYLLAEHLAQRAQLLIQRQSPALRQYRNLDDVISSLLSGQEPDPGDLRFLLELLQWKREDRYLCVWLRHQQENALELLGHVLHSDLFRLFPGSYILYSRLEQKLVLNLTNQKLSLSEVRHRLAPLCRDYCLYGGISSPVTGIHRLHQAHTQAAIALSRIFDLKGLRWVIPFADCALDHMLRSIQTELEPEYLVSPVWQFLIEYDRNNGTQYFLTLRTHLLLERDIPRTARALIIHRTTLIYRLKKIASLIGVDLEDPQVRLYLLLSLRLMEQHQLLPDGNPER